MQNELPKREAPIRLTNVFAEAIRNDPRDPRNVYINLPSHVFEYFFCHVLAGSHGSQQAIGSVFFKKLYDYLTNDLKLPKCYDPDNSELIARVLERISFAEPELPNNLPAPKRRRSVDGATKSPRKPKSADSE